MTNLIWHEFRFSGRLPVVNFLSPSLKVLCFLGRQKVANNEVTVFLEEGFLFAGNGHIERCWGLICGSDCV